MSLEIGLLSPRYAQFAECNGEKSPEEPSRERAHQLAPLRHKAVQFEDILHHRTLLPDLDVYVQLEKLHARFGSIAFSFPYRSTSSTSNTLSAASCPSRVAANTAADFPKLIRSRMVHLSTKVSFSFAASLFARFLFNVSSRSVQMGR